MSWIARCNGHSAIGTACNTVASLTKNFLAFATPLQVPRKIFWRLQHRCKSREKLSGVCNTVASPAKNFLAFATPLQVSRKTFWRLQHRCKSHEKLFGVCNTVASLTKTFWRLQHRCKHFQKRFGYRNSPLALFLHRTPRCVDEQKAREGAVLMRSPCQRPLARRGEIKTASIFAAAKRKRDGSVAQLDRATAF